jgi:hypothetical protein
MKEFVSSVEIQRALTARVQQRTGRRVRDLHIEVRPEGVVLRGHAPTFHVKQLAQHGVRDLLPQVELQNAIVVEK